MKKAFLVVVLSSLVAIAGCGKSESPPQRIQAIPENPADIDITGIESTEIAPGLSSRILLQGEGPVVESGQVAIVHYTGWLYDPEAANYRGTKFDSSVDRGAHFQFRLGEGRVIKGWDQGVVGMRVGEVRELTIAPDMAYGDRGAGGVIPPGATLVFVVELAGIEGVSPDAESAGN